MPTRGSSSVTDTSSIYIDDVSVTELDPLVGIPTNGVTLGSAAGGHLTNAYTFDGSNDNVNIYSTDLNGTLNPSEGSLVVWAKVSGAGVWTDGVTRYVASIQVDGNNNIILRKSSGSNLFSLIYDANGTSSRIDDSSFSPTGWEQYVITWSKSNDQVKAYVNGAQLGSTLTGLGTWVGNFSSTQAVIGSISTS